MAAAHRAVEYITVDAIEVITEFRRLELMGGQHAGLNDSFGRGGLQDVEDALRPWRGRLFIVAHLRFAVANRSIRVLPVVTVTLRGDRDITPIDVRATAIAGRGSPPGETLEAVFDARSVGQASRGVLVRWNEKELARITVDFARLK